MIRLRLCITEKDATEGVASHIKRYMMSKYLTTGDVNLGHLFILISAKFLHFFSLCNCLIFYEELFLDYIKIPCSSWNLHPSALADFLFQPKSTKSVQVSKSQFSIYIIHATFISWHSTRKTSFLFYFIYVYVWIHGFRIYSMSCNLLTLF